MLTRPAHSPMTSPAERVQLAAVFGMLGTLLGVLAVALAMWLYQIQTRIQDQNDSLIALERAVVDLGDNQRLAMDTLVQKIGVDKYEDFYKLYNKADRERDEAQRQLAIQRSISERIGGQAKELEKQALALDGKLVSARKDLERYENDAKEAPKLREKIASLEESVERKQRRLDELAPLAESDVGKATLDLQNELFRTRYLAYIGWGLTAVLGLALVVAYFYYKPPLETAAEPEPEAEGGERPTHRIV